MKPPVFDYVRVDSAEAAVDRLAERGDETKLLAGGQSLVPLLNLRLARPTAVVDIGRVHELAFIGADRDGLHVGAATTQADIERSALAAEVCPLLPAAVRHIGHFQIRNRGTIGGSIAHADPAAELPLVLLATDGSVRLRSRRGTRTVPASAFFDGFFTTAAAEDELVEQVTFPVIPPSVGWSFCEHARRPGDFAVAAVAVMLELADGKVGGDPRVAASGIADRPVRLRSLESALVGMEPRSPDVAGAIEDATTALDLHDDLFVSRGLRRRIVAGLIDRALGEAIEQVTP